MNRPITPLAQVCQRASAKPSAASRAIRPAAAGESIRPGGGREPVPSESLVAAITRLPPVATSGPSGMTDAATCLRAIHAPDLALVHSLLTSGPGQPRFNRSESLPQAVPGTQYSGVT